MRSANENARTDSIEIDNSNTARHSSVLALTIAPAGRG